MTVSRWLPLSIAQEDVFGGFNITLRTNTPCHLWLYWTDSIPWVHKTSKIDRGLAVPWDAYWCFVAWNLIDQEEAGDTLVHTYIWRGWSFCQTKYFRFHGTIGLETSPSDSPIFQKHYSFITPPLTLFEHNHATAGMAHDFGIFAGIHLKRGQSFSPQDDHTIARIKANLFYSAHPFDVLIEVYDAGVDHTPLGDRLTFGIIPASQIPPAPGDAEHPDNWPVAVLGEHVPVLDDALYIIVFSAPTSDQRYDRLWVNHLFNFYPRGRYGNHFPPPPWSMSADQSSQFEVWGY